MSWYKIAQLALKFEHTHEDFHNDQHDFVLAAKNAIDLNPVGMVEYSFYDENIYINNMLVKQDMRRQGIGTQMINEIKKEYPNSNINWGMTTTEGSSLYDSMENPTNEQMV